MDTKTKLVYPELSYQIIGIAFDIFNEFGFGRSEKYYQKVFAAALEKDKVPFKQEQLIKFEYKSKPIGKYFLDFVVDNKIVVELKIRPRFGYVHIKQVVDYLKSTGYKLAILIYFTRDGVKYRRVINLR